VDDSRDGAMLGPSSLTIGPERKDGARCTRETMSNKRMDGVSVGEVTTRVRQALAAAGFGVLTEIDVQATLKQEAGVERKPYLILARATTAGASALQAEPSIGVFLPCNVDIFEGDDGAVYVRRPSRRSCSVWSGIRRSDRSRRRSTQSSGRFSRPWWVETRRRRRYSTMATIRRPPFFNTACSSARCSLRAARTETGTPPFPAPPCAQRAAATSATTTGGTSARLAASADARSGPSAHDCPLRKQGLDPAHCGV